MGKAKPVTDPWFLKLKEDLQSGKKTVPVSYPNEHYNWKGKQVKGRDKSKFKRDPRTSANIS